MDGDAARRELREELGVEVISVGDPSFSVHDSGSRFVIVFLPAEVAGEPSAHEHSEIR